MDKCPLCDSQARFHGIPPLDTSWDVECDLCGRYTLADTNPNNIRHILTDGDRRHLVRGYLKEKSLRSGARLVALTEESAVAIADAAPKDVLEKLDRLLLNLASKTPDPGKSAGFVEERDYPLGYCMDSQEFGYLVQYLRDENLLKDKTITVPGWGRVRELQKAAGDSTQAFVAMWFDDQMDEAYELGIKPAIQEAGYNSLRIDKKEHCNRIDDEIILEINRSRFLVADFTGHRPGVYFEAGYALGQKKAVIWTVRKDQLDDVHFDTRQYNHIAWETPTELRERLYNRISVLVG